MGRWIRGEDSVIYRFQKLEDECVRKVVEIEDFDGSAISARLFDKSNSGDSQIVEELDFDSVTAAKKHAQAEWGVDAEFSEENSFVRIQRLTLSLLADYVGSDIVFGHEVPAETRDALAAAYEALDEAGIPLTFHDCPSDGAPLEQPPEQTQDPDHITLLECPDCGQEYLLDRETGELKEAEN